MVDCCGRGRQRTVSAEPEQPVVVKPPPKKHKIGINHQRTNDLNDDEKNAYHRPHSCTDFGTLIVFIAGLVASSWVLWENRENGDWRRLYHGIDGNGDVCGVDEKVATKPLLYWCLKPEKMVPDIHEVLVGSPTLDLQNPICVQSCPTGGDTHHNCFQNEETELLDSDDVTGTTVEKVTKNFRQIQDYETYDLAGRYCLPLGRYMLEQLQGRLENSYEAAMMATTQLAGSWPVLAGSAALAVVLGYVYLFLLGKIIDELIYITITLTTLLPIIAGCIGLYGVFQEDNMDEFLDHFENFEWSKKVKIPSTGNKDYDLAVAIGLIVFGLLVATIACCLRHSIQLAIGSIEAAVDALMDMPSLLLMPLLAVVLKLSILAVLGVGLAWLVSCGNVSEYDITKHSPTSAATKYVPGGLARSFTYTNDQLQSIGFYAFMAVWFFETVSALEQFTVAYSTQLWYFKDYVNGRKGFIAFPLVRGLFIGVFYHLGTLALGAFLLTLVQAIHFLLSALYQRMEGDEEDKQQGCSLMRCIASCCCCCLTWFECFIRFVNKNAYIVTAVESENFCSAAQIAFNILANEVMAIGALSIGLKVFTLAGVCSITGLGVYLTWLLITTVEAFADPKSEHFVPHPEYVAVASAVICAIIGSTFMLMFDTIADTILFCWALDRKERAERGLGPGNNVPSGLKSLFDRVENKALLGNSRS